MVLLTGALVWLVAVGLGQREHWQIHAGHGLERWLPWLDGRDGFGAFRDLRVSEGRLAWAVEHMQSSMDRPLDLLWLRTPDSDYLPSYAWGGIASALHPGRLRVLNPERHVNVVDGVIVSVREWDNWAAQPGMDHLRERFPHVAQMDRLTNIAVTGDLAHLIKGLEPPQFWSMVMGGPMSAAVIAERVRKRHQAILWMGVFVMVLLVQGWVVITVSGLGRGDFGFEVSDLYGTQRLADLPLFLAAGSVVEVAALWLAGVAGLDVGVWAWRALHLVPLWLALLLWRRRRKFLESEISNLRSSQRLARPASLAFALVGVTLLLTLAGPGPLGDAPGLVRDGYKAERFFEHGGMRVAALLPDAAALEERGFARPGYPPAWAGLTYAMALWCGGPKHAPFLLLPPLLLAAGLMLAAALAMGWLSGPQQWIQRSTALTLWLALAVSVPVLGYCGTYHSEPWLLLLLVTTWWLWLADDASGEALGRMPWGRVLLAALFLGALCSVKREGILWAGLSLVALAGVRGIDGRRWLVSVAMVSALAVPALTWRMAVGAPLEDFSWQSWTFWHQLGLQDERMRETWTEVSRWLWRWPKPQEAFAMMVPVGLVLWMMAMPWHGLNAIPGHRRRVLRHRLGQALPLLITVIGGVAAIVGMFLFSRRGDLEHHLTAVWRLLLPVAVAGFLLVAMALVPEERAVNQ